MDKISNIPVEIPTAPDLILDLLMVSGSALPVEGLCRAAALVGIGEVSVRVGLTRLVKTGKVRRAGRGSYAIDNTGTALSRTVDDWQHKHTGIVDWRGDWLAVHDGTVDRADKTTWRHHCLALALRGFATFQPQLHIRPNNLQGGVEAEREQLAALGLSVRSLVLRITDLDAARQAQACALWDVQKLNTEYRRLVSALERSGKRLRTLNTDAAARESLLLGRAVIGHLLRDPMLPPELMAPRERLALVDAMRRYQADALRIWRQWFGPPPASATPDSGQWAKMRDVH
ncbi:PaaX family transcriptional regulator [Variovorax sp. J22R133]|uniref:PaaX family transcriptional regulator n=1 Tax=Variovorax brevis TaxID=3053503 RepID=UPI002577BBDE|nr:PaaX family transcriptional regulator [Variovorax sp. J22R133]MDM0110931.1 PaaX family transcriptional regulator [Variovorax sp. J22R133]